jgi:hypothetical protein
VVLAGYDVRYYNNLYLSIFNIHRPLKVPPSLLYTIALMICIPLFALSNAGQVIYWVIGRQNISRQSVSLNQNLAAGIFVMFAHSFFYASEEV